MNRFDILSQFLKSYYTYIILITHIEGYSEYTCDNKIEVYKMKDRSKVWFCYDEYEENKEEEKDDIQVVISKKRGRKPKGNVIMV
jgi:hypothetical protein